MEVDDENIYGDDEPRPMKRFKSAKKETSSLVLRRGFHIEGNYPEVLENSKGEIILQSRCVIDCPGNEYFFQFIFRKTPDVHVCLLCPSGSSAALCLTGGQNKTSNTIKHIKKHHPQAIQAYQHLSEDEKVRTEKLWDRRKKNPDVPVKEVKEPPMCSTLEQTLMTQFEPLPIHRQRELWTRAIPFGEYS